MSRKGCSPGSIAKPRSNGVWEGSGNVICLDLVRVIRREPQVRDALRGEIGVAGSAALNALWSEIDGLIDQAIADEQGARWLAERIAIAVQYSCYCAMRRTSCRTVFGRARSRTGGDLTMGSLKPDASLRRVVERATVS